MINYFFWKNYDEMMFDVTEHDKLASDGVSFWLYSNETINNDIGHHIEELKDELLSCENAFDNPIKGQQAINLNKIYRMFKKNYKNIFLFFEKGQHGIEFGIGAYAEYAGSRRIIDEEYAGVIDIQHDLKEPLYIELPQKMMKAIIENNYATVVYNERLVAFMREYPLVKERIYIGSLRMKL